MSFKNYIYYSRNDSKREPIDSCNASNYLDAERIFMERKKLGVKIFNKLFEIKLKQ